MSFDGAVTGSMAVVPVVGSRPAVIKYRGGWVYIGVRDALHLQERKSWRRRLANEHPDHLPPGSTQSAVRAANNRFMAARKQHDAWVESERAWYAEFSLAPPSPHEEPAVIDLRQVERDLITQVLAMTGGVQSKAAELLGISSRVMNYKMMTHGLQRARDARCVQAAEVQAV